MNEEQWRRERDDRTLRYAGRRLDPNRWIAITAPRFHVQRYDNQVALLTAANLLGRMSPSIALSFPDAPVHPELPWANQSLHELILSQMRAADPYGQFRVRAVASTDSRCARQSGRPRNDVRADPKRPRHSFRQQLV